MAELKHTNCTIITICFTVILFAFLFSGCAKKTGVTAQKSANAKEQRTVSDDKELERMEQEIQDSPFLITAEYFRKTAGKGDTIKLFGPTEKDKELEERLLRLEQRMKGLPYRTKDSNGLPVLRRKVVLLSLLGDLGLEVLTRLPQALRSTDGVIPVDTSRLSRLLESQGLSVGDLVKTSVRREVANLAGIQAYILVSFPNGKPIQGKKSTLRIDAIHAVESVLIGSYLATIDDFDKVAPKISRDIVQATEWSCRIIKIDENSIYLNAGRLSGVQPGDRFQVYGKGAEIFDPVTKRSLGFAPGNFKGVIEVETLFGTDASRAKIISGGGFKVGDQVKILELS